MDIRSYIRNNFKDDDTNTIKESICESIKSKDEVLLPGLGVFLNFYGITQMKKKKIIS